MSLPFVLKVMNRPSSLAGYKPSTLRIAFLFSPLIVFLHFSLYLIGAHWRYAFTHWFMHRKIIRTPRYILQKGA